MAAQSDFRYASKLEAVTLNTLHDKLCCFEQINFVFITLTVNWIKNANAFTLIALYHVKGILVKFGRNAYRIAETFV